MSVNLCRSVQKNFANKLYVVQRKTIRWLAQRPTLTILLVVAVGAGLLPAVTVVMLTPLAVLSNYIGILVTPNGISTVYGILMKGFLLAFFFLLLLVIGFLVVTCISVMHSYRLFTRLPLKSKQQ